MQAFASHELITLPPALWCVLAVAALGRVGLHLLLAAIAARCVYTVAVAPVESAAIEWKANMASNVSLHIVPRWSDSLSTSDMLIRRACYTLTIPELLTHCPRWIAPSV